MHQETLVSHTSESQAIILSDDLVAVAGGSLIQFRFLGGVVGLAIVSNVFNSRLRHRLTAFLTDKQILSLDHDTTILNTFGHANKEKILSVFAREYNYQNNVMIAFAAAQMLAVAMVWNRKWSKLG